MAGLNIFILIFEERYFINEGCSAFCILFLFSAKLTWIWPLRDAGFCRGKYHPDDSYCLWRLLAFQLYQHSAYFSRNHILLWSEEYGLADTSSRYGRYLRALSYFIDIGQKACVKASCILTFEKPTRQSFPRCREKTRCLFVVLCCFSFLSGVLLISLYLKWMYLKYACMEWLILLNFGIFLAWYYVFVQAFFRWLPVW